MTAGIVLGCSSGLGRLTQGRSLLAAASMLGMVAVVAIGERRAALFGAASRVLEGEVFGLILPVALVLASRLALDPTRLDVAATPLARFGPSRRAVALGLVLASMMGAAALAAGAASAASVLAHDPTAPALRFDAVSCAWIGASGAAAYAALFALGATFGSRGGGRWWALLADFLLGSTSGVGALLTPRAHIQNLLGGEPPMLLGQSASAVCLGAMAVVFTGLALWRCPP
ncbi:MAG TPA: hypothetical protein VK540_16430 [Polyangiaceae bacterium]|nr:hypothetical protein [Polyangiaceae bacterium]